MTTSTVMRKQLFINGAWRDSASGATLDVINPATEEVAATVASAGQSDPYLNIFLRQPIPGSAFLTSHMEAVIDVRNLLAQGYIPLLGQDGHTVYLVQSARAIRGGVAFTF